MAESPRVGIDAHHLARFEGNRSYAVALLRAVARAGTTTRFVVRAYGPRGAFERIPGLDWGPSLPRSALARTALAIPLLQRRERLDLWHASFVAPPFATARLVLAVHDALALTRPELFGRAFALRMRVTLPRAIERARRVLVPTERVRDELLALGLGRAKTLVAPIGVDDRVFCPEGPRALGRYVLAVGRADRRKRLPELVRAFARIARPDERLVLAGPIDPGARQELVALAGSASLEVVRSPDETTLARLYRGARALAFPSADEGLGLPVIEALACGTPVVTSDRPVFREVAGDAAFAFVPDEGLEAKLAASLRGALDATDGDREALARRGALVARRFSLEAMARATEQAWREALEA